MNAVESSSVSQYCHELATWEKTTLSGPSRKGQYFGPDGSWYKVDRADFDLGATFHNHAYYTLKREGATASEYNVLNVGVGSGNESIIPLTRLSQYAGRFSLTYTATNINTPKDYSPPSPELLSGPFGKIDYNYRDMFFLETSEVERPVNLLLASRVIEWSKYPLLCFQRIHNMLAPSGIAIIHTRTTFPRDPEREPITTAQEAGFTIGNITVLQSIDMLNDVYIMYLYKPSGEQDEYVDWIRDPKHTFYNEFYKAKPLLSR